MRRKNHAPIWISGRRSDPSADCNLAGLDLPPFSALGPAAKLWLDTVANVRIHGETRQPPVELWQKEKPYLGPLPPHPFDIATVSQVRASKQFRITVETNRYSVPAHLAGQVLTLKAYPDRLCLYQGENRIARHRRSYDRGRVPIFPVDI